MASRLPDIRGVTNDQSEKGNRLNFQNIDFTLRDIGRKLKEFGKVSDTVKTITDDTTLFIPVSFTKTASQVIGIPTVNIDGFVLSGDNPISEYIDVVLGNMFEAKKKCTIYAELSMPIESTLVGVVLVRTTVNGIVKSGTFPTVQGSAGPTCVGQANISGTYDLEIGDVIEFTAARIYGTDVTIGGTYNTLLQLTRIK